MFLVININRKVSVSLFSSDKSKFSLLKNVEYPYNVEKLLSDNGFESFYDFLINNFSEIQDPSMVRIYLVLGEGSGIIFQTGLTNYDNIIVPGVSFKGSELESRVDDVCRGFLPEGAEELSEQYKVIQLSSYENGNAYYFSCAFFPVDRIERIKELFVNKGIFLSGIRTVPGCVMNSVNYKNRIIRIKYGNMWICLGDYGVYPWQSSLNSGFSTSEIHAFLNSEEKRFYGIEDDAKRLFFDIEYELFAFKDILRKEFNGIKVDSFNDVIGLGCVLDNIDSDDINLDVIKDWISMIRKRFQENVKN